MIRLETIQAFCDAFYFRLGDVLDVLPSAAQKGRKRISNQDFAAFYPNAREFSIRVNDYAGVLTVAKKCYRITTSVKQVSKTFNNL